MGNANRLSRSNTQGFPMASRSRPYVGVVHVHSDDPTGASIAEILAAARDNAVDFVVLTDSGTKDAGAEQFPEGWHEGVLLLRGEEVAAPDGHFLALEMRDSIGAVTSMSEALTRVRRQVGTAVSIHAQLATARRTAKLCPGLLPAAQADLYEVWSFVDEFLVRAPSVGFVQSATKADKLVSGPSRRVLNRWDEELGKRMLPGVGGLNAHLLKSPAFDWKPLFTYKQLLGTVQTVVHCAELPNNAVRARDMVFEALRTGRCYIANRAVAGHSGFRFYWKSVSGREQPMGTESDWTPRGRVYIELPEEGEIAIRHNGQPLFWGTGQKIDFPAPTPGVYRVEVRLNRRLWILSNPIRLTVDNQPIQPTVSDFT